jgi:hypothetical protein
MDVPSCQPAGQRGEQWAAGSGTATLVHLIHAVSGPAAETNWFRVAAGYALRTSGESTNRCTSVQGFGSRHTAHRAPRTAAGAGSERAPNTLWRSRDEISRNGPLAASRLSVCLSIEQREKGRGSTPGKGGGKRVGERDRKRQRAVVPVVPTRG